MISSSFELITGHGRYVGDEVPPGTLHAEFVRTGAAHGRLLGVETGQAESYPGVSAIHIAASLQAPDIPAQLRPTGPPAVGMERPVLARDRVRHMGEAVAMVLADRPDRARDAAEMVWPDIEDLAAVTDPVSALDDEVILFPEAGTNVVVRNERGSELFEPEGPVVVEATIRHPRLTALSIETLGILAVPSDEGVTVWCGHQAPHRFQGQLERILSLEGRVRVRVPDVGGGFGLKGQLYPEYLAVVVAALRHQRPVIWREHRGEHFLRGNHGRGLLHRVRLIGDDEGRINGLDIEVVANLGAYPQSGVVVPETAAMIGAGPYLPDFLKVKLTSVVTNTAPTGPYRGAGRPEAATALERTIDIYARRIGRDPVEVRRRNLIPASAMPFTTATGAVYDSGDYRAALDRAVELIDVSEFRDAQRAVRNGDGANPIGLGVAVFVEPAGGPVTSGEYGKVEIESDGTICIRTGSTSTGQPHSQTWKRVVAQLFDVEPASVRLLSGDTGEVADGVGSYGSRSTQVGAVALFRSAQVVLEKAKQVAASMLEASHHDLEVESSGFQVAGDAASRVELRAVADKAAQDGVDLSAEESYVPGRQTFPYGTHAAIVEVVRETGEVRLLKVVAVDDCGTILDPAGVAGQIYGGLAQGIGQALYEEVRYREDGQLLTASLMDYQPPRATDMPPIVLDELVTPSANELGVKGVGESGVVGLPVAVLNAVADALSEHDTDDLQLPLRPERIWEMLQKHEERSVGRLASPSPAER